MRKKILLLNTSFKNEGPNDVYWGLASHVDTSEFELIFGCMHEGGPMEKVYMDAGYRTHNFHMGSFANLGSVFKVRDFIKAEKIDLVTAQLLRAEVFGGLGTRISGVPLVLVIQNSDPYRANPRIFPHFFLSRLSMGWPVKIVAVSEYVRAFIIRHQKVKEDRVLTIHNAIDTEYIAGLRGEKDAVRRELGLGPEELVIGTAARFAQQKGLFYLLEAFSTLSARYGNIRLLLVGDGPLMGEMRKWCSRAGISDRVMFTGFRHDCKRILQAFDIYALPSLWEGLPLMLLSAMASGKPAVSTAVAGVPEVVQEGVSGLLIPPADASALTDRLELLIRDDGLRSKLGKNAQARVEEGFSAKVMAAKYAELWRGCLNGVSDTV